MGMKGSSAQGRKDGQTKSVKFGLKGVGGGQLENTRVWAYLAGQGDGAQGRENRGDTHCDDVSMFDVRRCLVVV